MKEEKTKFTDFKDLKHKSSYSRLRLFYRKTYIEQLCLELLLKQKYQVEKWVNRDYIFTNISPFYTFDLWFKTPAAMIDVCLKELLLLDLIDIQLKNNVECFQITDSGIECLKSFNIQNTAATTLNNFAIYRLSISTLIISALALVISIIAIILKT